MRAVSLRRARLNRVRRTAVATLFEAAPWCARCGRSDVSLAGHERLGRAQGGDPAEPDCLLCGPCNVWCEDNPIEAAWDGWKHSAKHPRSPMLDSDEAIDTTDCVITFTRVAS